MFQIELLETFSATHSVRMKGKWETPHRHYWTVRLFFGREKLNRDFMVADFHETRMLVRSVLDHLEGKDLNHIKAIGKSPTTELIARYLFDQINTRLSETGLTIQSVGLCETENCWAWYQP